MFVVAQFKGKEGILLQSTKAIVRRDLTGRSTMRWGTYLKRYGTLYLLLLVPLAFFIIAVSGGNVNHGRREIPI